MEANGHECVGACEVDEHARQIYLKHFPRTQFWYDATTIYPEQLPDFDCLCAGFPCQAFSIAGKRRGFEDTRGSLFFEIARIAKEKRPRILFLENVKGLLNHDGGETFKVIISTLDELGYDAEWQVLNSKYFVPQNRERVFIIGHLRGTSRHQVFPLGESSQGNNRARQETQGKGTRIQSEHSGAVQSGPQKGASTLVAAIDANYHKGYGTRTHVAPVATPHRSYKTQNGRRFKEDGEEMFTLTAQENHGIYDGAEIRRLTPLECERLQGFPDNWTEELSDTQRYKCCGNAVTVPVVKYIASHLVL